MEVADTINKMDGGLIRDMAGTGRAARVPLAVEARAVPGTPRANAPRLSWVGWLFFGLLVAMAVGGLYDLAAPNKAALLPLVAVPLVAGMALPVRATVVLALVSVVLAVVLPQALFGSQGLQYVRLTALVGVDVLAVASSLWRQRLEDAHLRLDVERERARVARRHALELNDVVYQSLFVAKMWTRLGRPERAASSLDQALENTSRLVAEGLEGLPLQPGAFLRETASGSGHRGAG